MIKANDAFFQDNKDDLLGSDITKCKDMFILNFFKKTIINFHENSNSYKDK